MEKIFKNLPLILLAGAIALSPSFSVGEIGKGRLIEIRAEDILLVILGLVWFANFLISGRKKIEKPPLFKPILAWLGIGFFSVLTNWIFGELEFSWGFFFFLKEIEFFFLYFYLFYHLKNLESAKFIVKLWIFLGLINVSWVIYELISGTRFSFYYGPTTFIEPRGSFPSAGFFLIIFLFLFNILIFHYLRLNISKLKKLILGLIIISLAAGVLVSGSRAGFFGLCFGLFLSFLLYFLREKKLKSFLLTVLTILFLFLIFNSISPLIPGMRRPLLFKGMIREYTEFTGSSSRISILKHHSETIINHPHILIFGLGVVGEGHSYLMRVLLERGTIGSFAFLFLMVAIIKKASQGFLRKGDTLSIGLFSGLFVATSAMLLMSIPNDPFMVVKIAEPYWFFTAITMAALSLRRNSLL